MARKMLAENPALKKEFEEKINNDESFSKDPEKILNWFYSRTPYWDNRLAIYPIAKIYGNSGISELRKISVPLD
jgi:hypothetical protein